VLYVCPLCWQPLPHSDATCPVHSRRAVLDRIGALVARRYRLSRLIGLGSRHTTVWEARDEEVPRDVAVKICPPIDPVELERTMHGTWVGSRLRHPGIAAVHEFGETPDGAYYCVMERLRGRTIQRLLERHPFQPVDAMRVAARALGILAHVHGQGIIHRDIKPANLFVAATPSGRWALKLLDFGIARSLDRPEPGDQDATRIVGTPEYMAPEQIVGGALDVRTDIYQVGVVLFRALTGRLPFQAADRHALYLAHLERSAPSLAEVAPHQRWPEELEDVIATALAKDPAERYATAMSMQVALRIARTSLGLRPHAPLTRRLAQPVRLRH